MYSMVIACSLATAVFAFSQRDHDEQIHFESQPVRIQRHSLTIESKLDQVITIEINTECSGNEDYYLTRPDGITSRIKTNNHKDNSIENDSLWCEKKSGNSIFKDVITIETVINKSRERNRNVERISLGPLAPGDRGSWAVTKYYTKNDTLYEEYQLIFVEILEQIPADQTVVTLSEGRSFNVSFPRSIPGLQSCELVNPSTTIDKFYYRDRNKMDQCGYVIDNIDHSDEGLWTIVAVADIVYKTDVYLSVV